MSKKINTYLPVVVSVLIIAAVVWVGLTSRKDEGLSTEWQTYHNEAFGYSFEYPSNLVIRDEGIKVSFDDESKNSQYIHAGLPYRDARSFGMTVVVNPSPYGMCEGAEWDVPDHQIGELTFRGCGYTYNGEPTVSQATLFVRNGDTYAIFLGYPMSLQSEAYQMAESFKLND